MSIAENLAIIAENIPKVYNAGYEKGKAEGGGSGYDEFWGKYQQEGERTDYRYAFAGVGWTVETFNPKHSIRPVEAQSIFQNSAITGDLDDYAIVDFSICKYFGSAFSGCSFSAVGVIDTSNAANTASVNLLFQNALNLTKVKSYIPKAGIGVATAFKGCTALEDLTIDGELSGTNINLQDCPLSITSMKSVIKHLAIYTGTNNEFKYTVTFKATSWVDLDAEGATSEANGKTWREYINDLGWNAS